MKRKHVVIAFIVLIFLSAAIVLWKLFNPDEFSVREDEFALKIKLDLNEDIGLIIYSYTADGHEFGEGGQGLVRLSC